MLLITNRVASADSGPLSILSPKPNEQVPFDVMIFEVTRRNHEWWLRLRTRETLADQVCRDIRHQFRDRGLASAVALYPAFRTATQALREKIGIDEERTIYLFSRCNGDPAEVFERGRQIEAASDVEVLCFSCPVERRTHYIPRVDRAGGRSLHAG